MAGRSPDNPQPILLPKYVRYFIKNILLKATTQASRGGPLFVRFRPICLKQNQNFFFTIALTWFKNSVSGWLFIGCCLVLQDHHVTSPNTCVVSIQVCIFLWYGNTVGTTLCEPSVPPVPYFVLFSVIPILLSKTSLPSKISWSKMLFLEQCCGSGFWNWHIAILALKCWKYAI